MVVVFTSAYVISVYYYHPHRFDSRVRGQNTTWSSKSNEQDKILPGLARAMEKTKYYLV
jgi:hypothetical protein